jgi:phosphotransferase system  glucose/maltose/N-acetylglucosamine-specific IIC component
MLDGKSWKTTSAGIVAIVGAITGLYFAFKSGTLNQSVITTAISAILVGIGLIFAKDSNVTGAGDDAKTIK